VVLPATGVVVEAYQLHYRQSHTKLPPLPLLLVPTTTVAATATVVVVVVVVVSYV
jgi:hypothetical protein